LAFAVNHLKLSVSDFYQIDVSKYWVLYSSFIEYNVGVPKIDEDLKNFVKDAPNELRL
jgi:hypothetical protein